jgi:hypothetical protein
MLYITHNNKLQTDYNNRRKTKKKKAKTKIISHSTHSFILIAGKLMSELIRIIFIRIIIYECNMIGNK